MKTDARHYDDDMDINLYRGADVEVARDGDLVRIEGLKYEEGETYAWGAPGVSLEVTPEDARELGFTVLKTADSLIITDLWLALDYAIEDLDYRLNQRKDYDEEDAPGVNVMLDRWLKLRDELTKQQEVNQP